MLDSIRESFEKHRRAVIAAAGCTAVVAAAALFWSSLFSRRKRPSETQTLTNTWVPLAELPELQLQLQLLVKRHEDRMAALAGSHNGKRFGVRFRLAPTDDDHIGDENDDDSAAAAAGGGVAQRDERDLILLAVDVRFQHCLAVLLPEDLLLAGIFGSDENPQQLFFPAVLGSSQHVQFFQVPRRLFVGVPPLSVTAASSARPSPAQPSRAAVPKRRQPSHDDGGESCAADEHAGGDDDRRAGAHEQPAAAAEAQVVDVLHFDDGVSAEFVIQEPPLASCLASHGLKPARWAFSITYFLRFPAGAVLTPRKSATAEPHGAGPASLLTIANLPPAADATTSLSGTTTATTAVAPSSRATSVAAANFFAMLVMSPEQELDRFLAVHSVVTSTRAAAAAPRATADSDAPQSTAVLMPAQMRIAQALPRLLRDAINLFYSQHAAVLGNPYQDGRGATMETLATMAQMQQHAGRKPVIQASQALKARQVAASFEEMTRRLLVDVLPERLFREAGVRIGAVHITRKAATTLH